MRCRLLLLAVLLTPAVSLAQTSRPSSDPRTARPPSSPNSETPRTGGPPPGIQAPRAWQLSFDVTEVSETDFDGAEGSVTARSTSLRLSHNSRLARGSGPLRFLTLRSEYRFTDFEFRDFQIGGMQLSPFDRVHATSIGGSYFGQLQGDWAFYTLASLTAAFEEGADVDQAIKPMTFGVVTYRFSETFTAGLGFGAIFDLDDRLNAFPVVSIDWNFAERWRFEIGEGAAVVYVADPETELEIRLQANFSAQFGGTRFRLADNGPAPKGTAEFEGQAIGVEATWKPTGRWELGLGVGFVANYELKIDNERNDRVFLEDIDPGLQVLMRVAWRF